MTSTYASKRLAELKPSPTRGRKRRTRGQAPLKLHPASSICTCGDCNLRFANKHSLARHIHGNAHHTHLSESTMWSIGWSRAIRRGVENVWSMPVEAPKPPIRLDEVYKCVRCKAHFTDAQGFKAHFIHIGTGRDRCLDEHELHALDYQNLKSGAWGTDSATQLLPSQIRRLATVRQELSTIEASAPSEADSAGPEQMAK